jgi:hypothetical protein
MNRQQKDAAFRGAAKAGLKEMDQRHANFTQSNCFNFQWGSLVSNWQLSKSLSRRFSQISADQGI